MMEEELSLPEDSRLKKCLQGSIRIYGSWDASDNSHYGFIYRTALLEITSINFQKRKQQDPLSETSNYFNTCAFSECHSTSNGSSDSEYFVCLEMKNVKCYTLRSLPFKLCFNKNGHYELPTNIVMCVKYPHFNHLKANYMTLSIQKRNKNKPKLLKFHQTVAHVYINMEYVLQNNRINSVTLDCNKSKVFDSCEIYFKSISTNAIPVTAKPIKKSSKNRWQIKGLGYPQMNFTRIFSPKLKRNFSYTKNTNVYNVAIGSDDEPNSVCYGDSSESANEESLMVSESSLDTTLVDNQVITPEWTPDATIKVIASSTNNNSQSPDTAEDKNNVVRGSLVFPGPSATTPVDTFLISTDSKKTVKEVIRSSSSISSDRNDNRSTNANYAIKFAAKSIFTYCHDSCSGNSTENEESSFMVPANILVFISDGISTTPKKLYDIYSSLDHPEINCVHLKSSTWIRQFIEEWNLIVNSEYELIDATSCEPKCRIFLFGNDKTINNYINELALCKISQPVSSPFKQISVTSNLLEFLFIPIEFPSCYFDHISGLIPSTSYKDNFGGKFWREFILNGIPLLDESEKYFIGIYNWILDSQQTYNHLIDYIIFDFYKIIHCPLGKAVLYIDRNDTKQLCAKDTEDILFAFMSSCQLINSRSKSASFSSKSTHQDNSHSKYLIEYVTIRDDTSNIKKIKVKNSSKIVIVPSMTHIEISIYTTSNDRYSISKIISKNNSSGRKVIIAKNANVYRYSKQNNIKFDVYIDGIVHTNVTSLSISYDWNKYIKTLPLCLPSTSSVEAKKENNFIEEN